MQIRVVSTIALVTCTEQLHMRVEPELLALMRIAARAEKKSLTRFVLDAVRRDINYLVGQGLVTEQVGRLESRGR